MLHRIFYPAETLFSLLENGHNGMSFVGIKDLMCTLHGIRQGLKFHLLLFLPKPKLSFFNFWKLLEWEQEGEGEGFCMHLQAGCGCRAQWWNHWAGCRFCPTEWEGLRRRSRSTGQRWRRLGHWCYTWGKAVEGYRGRSSQWGARCPSGSPWSLSCGGF